jgi:hypothetical protein
MYEFFRLTKAVKGLISRSLLNLASHRRGLEPEEIFQSGQIRHLSSSTQTAFPGRPFTRRSYASPYNTFTHFVKLPSGALGWHWSPLISEERGFLVHRTAAQCAILIIYDLAHISMAIRHRVLLSILPSPVAVCFGWSQKFHPGHWVFCPSAFREGGREAAASREAARRQSARRGEREE